MIMNVTKKMKSAGLSCAISLGLALGANAAEIGKSKPKASDRKPVPVVAPKSDEGLLNIKNFKMPEGFEIEMVAAEPLLANPVAFCIDWNGDYFISETHRYRSSVLDIRHYMFMLEDDLAIRTVEDRIAMGKKHFGKEADQLSIESEVVRYVQDTDGDGIADKSSIYGDKFNTALDGIASGVIYRDGKVYFTNIPNLWELEDKDKDGLAELRKSLSYGYGVRFSYTGHDMHGLAIGPDGKLYFSFGDRGANVTTMEGTQLAFPDEGAVFRCNLDGTDMEVVHSGLRNPQELAFDQYGNLFTGDNDCDNGDSERWVQVVEGGESGWRVGYQHAPLGKAGQWMSEKLWVPRFKGQAAYLLPPIANIMDGPSGLTFNPGTGLPASFDGHFFLTHFKGQATRSGISTFKTEVAGASFTLGEQKEFIWGCLPTDVDFGYNGNMYFTDWHHDWPKSSRGRIYRLYHPETVDAPAAKEVEKIFKAGFRHRKTKELVGMLSHVDKRVRQEAQFTLVDKKASRDLLKVAKSSDNQLARLHGVWGVGQLARKDNKYAKSLVSLLKDKDSEVRAQVAKVIGDSKLASAEKELIKALQDSNSRVRFQAANALGKVGTVKSVGPLVEMIRENADRDLYLRHGGIMGILGIDGGKHAASFANDHNRSVRLAALLVMRRTKDTAISQFLKDSDSLLVLEAARAINDVPIADAYGDLAQFVSTPEKVAKLGKDAEGLPDLTRPMMLRVVNASFRNGTGRDARALAALAANDSALTIGRTEALNGLATWAEPFARDRIVGVYRPLAMRNPRVATTVLEPVIGKILSSNDNDVIIGACDAVTKLKMKSAGDALLAALKKTSLSTEARVAALQALAAIDHSSLGDAIEIAMSAKVDALKKAGTGLVSSLKTSNAVPLLTKLLESGSRGEKQGALASLAKIKTAEAEALLGEWLKRLKSGKVQAAIQLEVLEAAYASASDSLKEQAQQYEQSLHTGDDKLAPFRMSLAGGEVKAGRKVFLEKVETQCVRCHKLKGQGGDVGPAVDGIAKKLSPEYLLESVVLPSAKIAQGYENLVIRTKDGGYFAGMFKKETDKELTINAPEDGLVTIKKADIESREQGLSGMPAGMGYILSKRELRDLMAFLTSLKR